MGRHHHSFNNHRNLNRGQRRNGSDNIYIRPASLRKRNKRAFQRCHFISRRRLSRSNIRFRFFGWFSRHLFLGLRNHHFKHLGRDPDIYQRSDFDINNFHGIGGQFIGKYLRSRHNHFFNGFNLFRGKYDLRHCLGFCFRLFNFR